VTGVTAQPGKRATYPTYRASRVPWLGDVPEHWHISPLYARYKVELGKMLDAKQITGECSLPYVRNVDVQWDRVNTDDLPEMDITPAERGRFTLEAGDLLVCEGGEVGRSAIWQGDLASCGFQKAIHRLRPRTKAEVSRFFFYVMRAAADSGFFVAHGNPNTIAHLTAEKFRVYRFPFPPYGEQKAIAAFLDQETARIDTLIEKKRRQIELLQEKRSALLSHAVTKGLDPNAPMKASGIAWLGAVPAHWTVANIRRFAKMRTGHTPSRTNPEYWHDCTIPWFTLADVWQLRDGRRKYLGETKEKISELGLANSAAELLPQGTVVFSRTASVGFSGIMPQPMATSQDFWNWICLPSLVPEYLLCLFRAMRQEFEAITMGSTHKTIYQPIAAGIVICIPPPKEQQAIAAHVDAATGRIDSLVEKVEQSIEGLRELRTALISAAVTGKIDVRTKEATS